VAAIPTATHDAILRNLASNDPHTGDGQTRRAMPAAADTSGIGTVRCGFSPDRKAIGNRAIDGAAEVDTIT